jgi:transposase-like protein
LLLARRSPASGSRLRGSCWRCAGICGSGCPTATSRSYSPSVASRWTTSPCTGGCSGSRRCWPTRPVRPAPRRRPLARGRDLRQGRRWVYLYRAVDQFGQVIDVYASTRRDSEAAHRFFQRARITAGVVPVEVVTDRAPTYPPSPRRAVANRRAPRRAIRQQSGRGRPRAAEMMAATDARDQDHDRVAGTCRRPRVRAEPASRPLRDRRRPTSQPSTCHRVRPTSDDSLKAASDKTPASHAPRSANATDPLEELLAERGIDVDHVTVHRRVRRFSPLPVGAAGFCRRPTSPSGHAVTSNSMKDGRWAVGGTLRWVRARSSVRMGVPA